MSANISLVTGPVASGKTQCLLDRFREVANNCAALWLGPSERACTALRPQILGTNGAVPTVNLLTFPEFARQIVRGAEPDIRTLPELHQRLLLDDILADLVRSGELPYFAAVADSPGFRDAVFDFITELKGQGIAPESFEETIRQFAGGDAKKAEQVARVFARYQKRLTDRRLLDREAIYVRARQLWSKGRRGPFAAIRCAFVDGFADFTPPQLDLLATVADTTDQVWITVLSDRDGDATRAELFSRPADTAAKLFQRFGKRVKERIVDHEGIDQPPAGLTHLETSLFRPESPPLSTDAAGLRVIEAPGIVGEARLVARAVKTLLLDGMLADEILITARDLGPYADLVREVFADYGIPAHIEGTDPLIRNAAVGVLLRAVRLADDGFPFAATTAILRSTYFRPLWPEVEADADVAGHAEVLLRLLGEPRGREAYLEAARLWAAEKQPGLEDEQAEESRRRRKHVLAKRCLPFLERFFAAWDKLPVRVGLPAFAEWLREFSTEMGFAAEAERTDTVAWSRFRAELDDLAAQEEYLHARPPTYDRSMFHRLLTTITSAVGLAKIPAASGEQPRRAAVRVLSADQARHLDCDHLIILGMGERSFPNLGGGGPLFDEAERQAFRGAGMELRSAADRLPDEMLLFYQLATRPRRQLTMSYPAVDEKGQSLLPSTFLTAALECFGEGVVPIESQRMLIDGYDRIRPLSPAEYRVRWALANRQRQSKGGGINPSADAVGSPDLFAHLAAAGRISQARRDKEFSPYDGRLRAPGIIADLSDRFGSKKIFSPTALENYVACPFRFYLEDVLKLEPLEEPGEEVEATRRGAAFHRALSRLHVGLKADGVNGPAADVTERLGEKLRAAIEEYAARVASPAGKMLWRLEGQRLDRSVARYGIHWQEFQKPWQERAFVPRPLDFEVDFGLDGAKFAALVIKFGEIEVRIGGRIDRVDTTEFEDGTVGFWVIDYKTGRSGYYTGSDLTAMKKLQLSLYALAVERLLLPGGRPLGLAYWLVADGGSKVALPGRPATGWLTAADRWPRFRAQLEEWVTTLVGEIRGGAFPLQPRAEDCTSTCPYGQVCRIAESRSVEKTAGLPLPVVGVADEANADD